MTILFVDDSAEYLRSMKDLCEHVCPKREVKFFHDAFEAMNFITYNSRSITGVITDYKMPAFGVSGDVIIDKCKEMKVPVFVCTGYEISTTHLNPDVKVIGKTSLEDLIDTITELEK